MTAAEPSAADQEGADAVGFSFRIAPGVRVRASSRGIRTSIGPRVARLHVGAGTPGISTGIGPVGFYQSLGGGRRSPSRPSASAAGRSLADAKLGMAQELLSAIQHVQNLHREGFAESTRPTAAAAPPIDTNGIRRRHAKAARAGVPFWDWRARSQAREKAAAATAREIAEDHSQRLEEQQARQEGLDLRWKALNENDPETVREVLSEAFEDNDAHAVAVACNDGIASVVVLVPDVDVIPDRFPTTTTAGNLSLKRMSKTDQAALYRTMVAGYLLVTAKEAFAVAPRLEAVRAVAIRTTRRDAYGTSVAEALVACHLRRSALVGVRWDDTDAAEVLVDAADALIFTAKGATKTLTPINLAAEPDIAELLASVDVDELEEPLRPARP